MDLNKAEIYNSAFYGNYQNGMQNSARIILKYLFELLKKSSYSVNSMLDIGCGQGNWCKEALGLGLNKVHGIDGQWAETAENTLDNFTFIQHDFTNSLPNINDKFDLTISLEFAEHITEDLADDLVKLYCSTSDVILFGAATKNQFGLQHVNEQLLSYWIVKFAVAGYQAYDIIRPQFWNNAQVELWYKQNPVLFINKKLTGIDLEYISNLQRPLVDVVHPGYFASRTTVLLEEHWELNDIKQQLKQLNDENRALKQDNEIVNQELYKVNQKYQQLEKALGGNTNINITDIEQQNKALKNFQEEYNPYRSKRFG